LWVMAKKPWATSDANVRNPRVNVATKVIYANL
jgi:hypothetical protein